MMVTIQPELPHVFKYGKNCYLFLSDFGHSVSRLELYQVVIVSAYHRMYLIGVLVVWVQKTFDRKQQQQHQQQQQKDDQRGFKQIH